MRMEKEIALSWYPLKSQFNIQRLAHSVSRFFMPFSHNWQCSRLITGELQVRPLQAAPHRQHVRQNNLIAKHGSPSKGRKDTHMALERKTLRAILEDETTDTSGKLKKILDVLHEETDALQNQLDEKDAAIAKAEKERDAANSGKQTAEQALTDYKAQQTQKDAHAAKEAKFREQLKAAGVLEKYFDRIVRLSGEDIDKMELDSKNNVKNADKLAESLKTDWSDYVGSTSTKGAPVDNPPTNNSGVSKEDFEKMSLDARIKLKNENPELYQQLRKK